MKSGYLGCEVPLGLSIIISELFTNSSNAFQNSTLCCILSIFSKFLFIEQIISRFAALFNDISLAQYDIRRCRMIYFPAAVRCFAAAAARLVMPSAGVTGSTARFQAKKIGYLSITDSFVPIPTALLGCADNSALILEGFADQNLYNHTGTQRKPLFFFGPDGTGLEPAAACCFAAAAARLVMPSAGVTGSSSRF